MGQAVDWRGRPGYVGVSGLGGPLAFHSHVCGRTTLSAGGAFPLAWVGGSVEESNSGWWCRCLLVVAQHGNRSSKGYLGG